ncbi:MAG: hypothetical protein ABSF77_10690 [Spirochaetia bacterium]
MRMLRSKNLLFSMALLALVSGAASGLDLGVEGWLGNLGFSNDRTVTDLTMPGSDYFWGLSLYGTQSITDAISFETGFYSDPILRNTCYTLFGYHEKILSVGVGPFFGIFNDAGTLLKSGISTAVRLELPGIVFVSFRSDSSIGGELVQIGDYLQSRNDISFGVYLPNAICTLSLNSSTFQQKAAASDVIDSLTVYAFSTDIYKKNVPYRLIVTFSYQSLARSFVETAATTTASLNSVIIGTEIDITLAHSLLLQAGIEGNVYSFGLGTLVGSDTNFLFRSFAGLKMNLDSIPYLSRIL